MQLLRQARRRGDLLIPRAQPVSVQNVQRTVQEWLEPRSFVRTTPPWACWRIKWERSMRAHWPDLSSRAKSSFSSFSEVLSFGSCELPAMPGRMCLFDFDFERGVQTRVNKQTATSLGLTLTSSAMSLDLHIEYGGKLRSVTIPTS